MVACYGYFSPVNDDRKCEKYLKSFLAALCSHFSRNDKVLILRPEAIAEVYVQNYAYQLVVFASQEYSE